MFEAVGQEVLRDGEHFADACNRDAAVKCAEALNKLFGEAQPCFLCDRPAVGYILGRRYCDRHIEGGR